MAMADREDRVIGPNDGVRVQVALDTAELLAPQLPRRAPS